MKRLLYMAALAALASCSQPGAPQYDVGGPYIDLTLSPSCGGPHDTMQVTFESGQVWQFAMPGKRERIPTSIFTANDQPVNWWLVRRRHVPGKADTLATFNFRLASDTSITIDC